MSLFSKFFGADNKDSSGSTGVDSLAEIDTLLDSILNLANPSSERREMAYNLRMLSEKRDFSKAFAISVMKRLEQFEVALLEEENEEVAQTLLEILRNSSDRGHEILLKTSSLIITLLETANSSKYAWVKVCAIQCIQSLTLVAPQQTVDHLLSIPSALENLVEFLNNPEVDVRNEMIVLLHRLTEASEQVRMFMTFCDGSSSLLTIAMEEQGTIVSSDCLSVCLNTLRGNPVGQKQFLETKYFLDCIASLLIFDINAIDPTSVILRLGKCVEIIRILCQGRVENKSLVVRDHTPFPSDERRFSFLKDAQNKLGSIPSLFENLFLIASDSTTFVEDSIRRESILALGDLICRNPKNGTRLERLAGFSFLATSLISATRWADAKACFYALICALDGEKEGEQRSITLFGHAVAPPPETYAENGEEPDEKVDNPVLIITSTLTKSIQSIILLRNEVYVDPSQIIEHRNKTWRTIQMLLLLLQFPSAKELALKVTTEGGENSFFFAICEFIHELLKEKDETDAVKYLANETCCNLIKLLIVWINHDETCSNYLLSSASNLFFFEPFTSTNSDAQGLCFILVAASFVSTWKPQETNVAFGLLENKIGVELFLQSLSSLKDSITKGKGEDFNWDDDSCSIIIFDSKFSLLSEKIIREVNSLLVKGSSAPLVRSQANSIDNREIGGALNSSETEVELRKLQKGYARLLLVIAQQEVEKQSLLQTIKELGGQEAFDMAVLRSETLLAKALENAQLE